MPNERDTIKFSAEVLNGHKVEKLLNELPQKIRGRIMREAFKQAVKPIKQTMKQEVPKLMPQRTNDPRPKDETLRMLRTSVTSVIRTYRTTGITFAAVGPRRGKQAKGYHAGTRLDKIAIAINEGWKQRNSFVNRTQMYAKRNFPNLLGRQLNPAIEKEAARLAKRYATNKLTSSERDVYMRGLL